MIFQVCKKLTRVTRHKPIEFLVKTPFDTTSSWLAALILSDSQMNGNLNLPKYILVYLHYYIFLIYLHLQYHVLLCRRCMKHYCICTYIYIYAHTYIQSHYMFNLHSSLSNLYSLHIYIYTYMCIHTHTIYTGIYTYIYIQTYVYI